MRRPTLLHATIAATFLAAGVLLAAGLNLDKGAQADRLWTEKKGAGGLDPNGPVSLNAFSRLAKTLSPAVVNITVNRGGSRGMRRYMERHFGGMPKEFQNRGLGTGFIIHPDGWILTNNHVIENANRIDVRLADEQTYRAKVVGADPRTDVALLKIEPRKKLTVAPLGDSDRLEIGEWVVAIGNPFGLSHTVTAGIVSAKGRKDVNPDGRQLYADFIQTDASINPGNSGGPLINISGEVIGINSAINAAGQGIGFAIPINMIKTLIPQLRRGRVTRSWLGVMIKPVDEKLARQVGLDAHRGALVAEVVTGGPADRGGIQPGDIITHFDGKSVRNSKDLPWLASTAGIGRQVKLVVWRNGREARLDVKLGELPKDPAVAARRRTREPTQEPRGENLAPSGLGLTVAPLGPALKRRLGIAKAPDHGLVVVEVDDGGPAQEGGVQPGDVLLKVSYQAVTDMDTFRREVAKVKRGEVVSLLVSREGRRLFLAFTRQ